MNHVQETKIDKLPIEIFIYEILCHFSVQEICEIEKTCRYFQKTVTHIDRDIKIEKMPKPGKEWILKYKNVTLSVNVAHSSSIELFEPFCEENKSIRRVKCFLGGRGSFGASFVDFALKHGELIHTLRINGIPRNSNIGDSIKDVFTRCKNLKRLYFGTKCSRDSWIGACPIVRLKDSSKTFAPLIDNNIKFEVLALFGVMEKTFEKHYYGPLVTNLLKNTETELKKLNVCWIQYPRSVPLSDDFLKRFPNLKRVRLNHPRIEILFRHHSKIEMYEGKISDSQLLTLTETNGENLKRLIIYDQYPERVEGGESSNYNYIVSSKVYPRLTDIGISSLKSSVKMTDFRIYMPYEVGNYRSYVSEECMLDTFGFMEKRYEKNKDVKKSIRGGDIYNIEYKENGVVKSRVKWRRRMDLDPDCF